MHLRVIKLYVIIYHNTAIDIWWYICIFFRSISPLSSIKMHFCTSCINWPIVCLPFYFPYIGSIFVLFYVHYDNVEPMDLINVLHMLFFNMLCNDSCCIIHIWFNNAPVITWCEWISNVQRQSDERHSKTEHVYLFLGFSSSVDLVFGCNDRNLNVNRDIMITESFPNSAW